MQEVEWGTSGGYYIRGISEHDYECFLNLRREDLRDPIQGDVFALGMRIMTIEEFKKKWKFSKLISVDYGPCGHHEFSIRNDEFVDEDEIDVG